MEKQDIEKLQVEYAQVQTDIKAHIMMIKTYLTHIQESKNAIDSLGKRLSELQTQYLESTKEE